MSRDRRPEPRPPLRPILLTMERAAASLNLSYGTFRDRVLAGEIAFVCIDGGPHRQRRHFRPEDLIAWAMRNRVAAKWEAAADEQPGKRNPVEGRPRGNGTT